MHPDSQPSLSFCPVYFAIEGIVEIYEERDEMKGAIPHLEAILDEYPDNLTVRTITRFKLRDIYNEAGERDRALEQLEAIIAENR